MAKLFSRRPASSIWGPPDTVYLSVRQGKVKATEPEEIPSRSPSPSFSDFEGGYYADVRPPVPLKSRTSPYGQYNAATTSPPTSSIPTGYSAKAREWQSPSLAPSLMPHLTPSRTDDFASIVKQDLHFLDDDPFLHEPKSHFSWTTSDTRNPMYGAQSPVSLAGDFQASPGREEMPKSRFSWTTYNTEAPRKTPIGSQAASPSMRSPPSPPLTPPSPVMNRRRPVPKPDAAINSIKRKPTPSMMAESAALSSSNTPNKALPPAPAELESIDIISALQAQMRELELRRFNLDKMVSNAKTVQPQNPMVYNLAKRRELQERVRQYETELAEVRSKEHELGLRLHRALKRRDQEEPSGLWVRRVTS